MFFGLRVARDIVPPARSFLRAKGKALQLSLAQITGITVTFVYGFGSDLDLVFALPVGILAGCVAEMVFDRLTLAAAKVRVR
jgi:hypothetical protein